MTGEVYGRCHSSQVLSCKVNKHYAKGGEWGQEQLVQLDRDQATKDILTTHRDLDG